MIKRPKVGESEEDLLKHQENFFKTLGKEAPRRNEEESEEKGYEKFQVLGDIKEKNLSTVKDLKVKSLLSCNKGFPKTFVIDSSLTENAKGRKSLFAMQMEKKKKKNNEMEVDDVNTQVADDSGLFVSQNSHSDKSIHEENLEKISAMSQREIIEEQKNLLGTLDPNLIEFLKNRNKGKREMVKTDDVKTNETKHENFSADEEKVKENIKKYIDSRWINMDFLEKEKLEWIEELPDKKSLEPDQPYSARFDFKGDLQPFATEIDVRNSLYHHGEEPDRPGYTIQELYQLSRSNVLQQRILALNTLANIIRKTKLGYYDRCFEGQLLHKLVESDLFFIIRFSIDENSLVPSSIYCLYNLLYSESDEFCLDKLLGVNNTDEQPLLFKKIEVNNKDEENELKDHVLIGCDMVKGVLRTDLLKRLAYVLNKFSSTRETLIRVTKCLIRISRHSLEASEKILYTSSLLEYIYKNLKTNTPFSDGVKLLRVMATHSKQMASQIIKNYDINFMVSFVEAEENVNISRKEFYLLKLETLYFWRSLLLHDLAIDEFVMWSPCLIRLLLFYTQKVDVNAENDFDFELFSAKTSLLIVCNKKKVTSDLNIVVMMRLCLEKWLTQLIQYRQYNYAVCKAIGSAIRFFITYFRSFGVNSSDLEFINKINAVLLRLFSSEIFYKMSSCLRRYSYILSSAMVTRDPDNLPSLCSVYNGGDEFLRIVQSRCTLPFFISISKYLRSMYRVSKDLKVVIEAFTKCSEICSYVTKVCELGDKPNNWFTKYETEFLTNFLQLLRILEEENVLMLSFRLLPLLRIDDKRAVKVLDTIFDKRSWKSDEDFLRPLSSLYSEFFLQIRDNIGVVNYSNELIPEEWVYKILGLLRGKEAVDAVKYILSFIYLILSKNVDIISRISYTFRYYYLCSVFLTDSNVFDEEIQNSLKKIFHDVVGNSKQVNLDLKVDKKKSFYDLFTELVVQYGGVSYGLPIFAQFVLFPLQNRFNVAFRKLLWFEYSYVLRVVTLSFPVPYFVDLESFIEPCETDESLLVAYLNSVSNNVILKSRNPFIYQIAIGNIHKFLHSENPDEKLLMFIKRKIENLKNEDLKNDILNFTVVSEP